MAEASVSLDRAGQRVADRYLVEELLGQGGMATVYRVLDQATGVRCALKRVRSSGASSESRRQQLLEREYYTLAQLAHPRIIAVHDFGRDDDGPFYTMELLDGSDLASLGRVPWQSACALLRDVASSLAILHSRGLLHRDVSARNVRCDASGRAKLIDFGALCSMGLDLEVVGTPPFVAPEALQMQALDARTDLYALGALGYYLLSGRHAYAARQLRELRDAWRTTPPALKRLVPEVPASLSDLIMELLALDRGTRPQSSAEIMKRLCSIAQLPVDEDVAVSRAYLAAPALVGREQALLVTRKQLLSLARGDGQTLLIEGAPGSGRSRMLDASVLEGKMLSAFVLRAHATDGAGSDWAVARSLATQLMSWTSEKVEAAARLSRPVLSHVIDGLVEKPPTDPMPDRSLLIRELRDFILKLAEGQRVLIAVDDVDRIDEPSLALLAAIANKTERHPLVLALTAPRDDVLPGSASMRLLHSLATRIELAPFTPSQTEVLLGSVFGNVHNLQYVAAHIQRLAQGNPRATMELAEYLVERGLCRYEDGRWSLPAQLIDSDLPASLAEQLEARMRALPPDARSVCEAACIVEVPAISIAQLSALTDGWPAERVFAALTELVSARVLVADAEFYRFSQPGYVAVARGLIGEAKHRLLHGRMADQLQAQGVDSVLVAHHLLEADRDEQAIGVLERVDARTHRPPHALLERALVHAQRRGMPARVIAELRINVVSASVFALDFEAFLRVSPAALANLLADSGLGVYDELTDLPPSERLAAALQRTQTNYDASPPQDRAYSVEQAIRRLARLSHSYMVMGLWSCDLSLIESFPDLEPLLPLSPSIGVLCQLLACGEIRQRGRLMRALEMYAELLDRIGQPDRAGFEPEQNDLIRNVCLLLVGGLEASAGMAKCEERAQQLEADRAFRMTAWRMRQLYALSRGDVEEARKCMRRAELLQLQDGLERQAHGAQQGVSAIAFVRTDDLLAIEDSVVELSGLAESMPHWRPILRFCQAAALRLRGDPEAALNTLLPAFELAPAGVHWMFGLLASSHVQLLNALGRWEEAVERSRVYLEVGKREELTLTNEVYPHLVLALTKTGRAAEGLRLIETLLEELETVGYGGVMLGAAYEAAARICVSLEDSEGFQRYFDRCSQIYGAGNNRVLHLRLAQLRAEADPEQDIEALVQESADATRAGEHETIYSRIAECVDPTDRARCALTMLLQQAERFSGYWFAYTGDAQLELRASLPADPDAALVAWVDSWFRVELERRSESAHGDLPTSDEMTEDSAASRVQARHRDADGRVYEALLLSTLRDGFEVAIGALVLEIDHSSRVMPNQGLIAQIAKLMLGHGDVTAALPESR